MRTAGDPTNAREAGRVSVAHAPLPRQSPTPAGRGKDAGSTTLDRRLEPKKRGAGSPSLPFRPDSEGVTLTSPLPGLDAPLRAAVVLPFRGELQQKNPHGFGDLNTFETKGMDSQQFWVIAPSGVGSDCCTASSAPTQRGSSSVFFPHAPTAPLGSVRGESARFRRYP